MQQIACTLSRRIISASEMPELRGAHRAGQRDQHLPAPIEVRGVASAASFRAAALKCRKWRSMNTETGPLGLAISQSPQQPALADRPTLGRNSTPESPTVAGTDRHPNAGRLSPTL